MHAGNLLRTAVPGESRQARRAACLPCSFGQYSGIVAKPSVSILEAGTFLSRHCRARDRFNQRVGNLMQNGISQHVLLNFEKHKR